MNARIRLFAVFYGYCLIGVLTLATTVFFIGSGPHLGQAILIEWIAILVGAIWIFKRLGRNLPPATTDQKARAARNAQRMGWIYLGGLVLGLLVDGKAILWGPPHGLGFLLPLIPISLSVYYLRLSARLKSSASMDSSPPA
jgi:hypothetical protein